MQDIDALFDKHLDYELAEHEKRCEPEYITNCENCCCVLYEGEEAYKLDGEYYCEVCIDKSKITL